jgi:hypothetical protein
VAKGFSSVKEAGKDIEKRKNAAGGDFPQRIFFKINDGETAVVRFLEQNDDVQWAWVHTVDDGSRYGRKVVCRDQDEEGRRIGESCPGCEEDLKRTFRGAINLIWRYTGEERENVEDDVKEDVLAVLISGPRMFVETLDPLNAKYSGLCSRDFEITRHGSDKNTSYSVFPADPDGGKKALSKADKLLETEKNDLSWYVDPPPYEDWGKTTAEKENNKPTEGPSVDSPFRNRRKALANA